LEIEMSEVEEVEKVDKRKKRVTADADPVAVSMNFRERTHSWVTFAKPDRGQDAFVCGSHNTVAWKYARGMRVPVPDIFIKGCLETATTRYLDQDANELREEPSYAYTVHGPATTEEVDAWRKANLSAK
jgi:hypothetical protein